MASRPANYLLQQLSDADFQAFRRDLEPVSLNKGQVLYEPEQEVDRVYFPESGLITLLNTMISGATAETAAIGRGGGVGFVEACGSEKIFSRAIVQLPGVAWLASASRYRRIYHASRSFRVAIHTSVELQLTEARQNLACNSVHPAHQRLARWLLDCQEASGCGDDLSLTHEFLSAMISVQRTTVTLIVGQLEAANLIRQGRGHIIIKDRAGLAARACECRDTVASLRRAIEPKA